MSAGQKVIFHHISKSAGTSMVKLLRRNYPRGALLEIYDRRGSSAPEPRLDAYARYLTTLDPERWEKVRCLAGHSANFAIPALGDPVQAFAIVRDPVERVVSLYYYLRGRAGFGESGDVAGELIRERNWSLADIYQTFGGSRHAGEDEHRFFADFFNGQARSILAPHFAANHIPMTEGQMDLQPALQTLEAVLTRHYVLGSAARYGASVERLAAEFGWRHKTVTWENATPGRPATDDVPADVKEMIRAYNAMDEELHARALAELAAVPDPEEPATESPRRRATRTPAPTSRTQARSSRAQSREVKELELQLRAREHALAQTQQALERAQRTGARTAEALSRMEQARRDVQARLDRHERELGEKVMLHERSLARTQAQLARARGELEQERQAHHHLRGVAAGRERRLQELTDQLAARERELSTVRDANQELAARLREREGELAAARDQREYRRLREELGRAETALNEAQTELGALRGEAGARSVRLRTLAEQLASREDELAQVNQARRELEARAEPRERELAELHGLLARLLSAGRPLAGELGLGVSDGEDARALPGAPLLEATLERARVAISTAAEERHRLDHELESRSDEVEEALRRERALARSIEELEEALAQARSEAESRADALTSLLEERRALAAHARRLVSSRAWRYGHGVSIALRRIILRPSKARSGAAETLLEMLEAPPRLPPPPPSANGRGPSGH